LDAGSLIGIQLFGRWYEFFIKILYRVPF